MSNDRIEELGADDDASLGADDLVSIERGDGVVEECVLLGVVDHEGALYAVLTPRDQLPEDDDVDLGDLYVTTYVEDADGTARFGSVDDPGVLASLQHVVGVLVGLEEDDAPSDAPGTLSTGPVAEA